MRLIMYFSILLLSLSPLTSSAEVLFFDGFESGDMSTTNSDGFTWGANNRTSVVTMDPTSGQGTCLGNEIGARAIWNNGAICNPSYPIYSDWTAKTGRNSLRFRYAAGEEWAEQQFTLGGEYPELWMAFWLRVPVNFYKSGGNFKLWRIWMGDYANEGTKVGSEFRNAPPEYPDGSANVYLKAGTESGDTAHYAPFITVPDDRGRWMHIVVYVKPNTEVDSANGIIRQWRRWADESEYTLMNESVDRNIQPSNGDIQGFNIGYLMGWANGAYAETTEFLLDDFTLSTTSLLDSVPVDPPTLQNKPARIRAINQPATISPTKQPVRVR